MSPLVFSDDPAQQRFEARRDGALAAFIDYRRHGAVLRLVHTEVLPGQEGQGLGSALARHVLDEVRRQGGQVIPACDFIARWIGKHPAYADRVASSGP